MLPVLILRPADSASETLQRVTAMGLKGVVDPLFAVETKQWTAPPASDFDALMLTSANALGYAEKQLHPYRGLPVLAVGEATAKAAREAGFTIAVTGQGGADDLLQSLPVGKYSRILRLIGKHYVRIADSDRQIMVRQVYESVAIPLGAKAQAVLKSDNITLLYSVRAATILQSEMERLGLDTARTHIAALSENIAEAAGTGWKSIHAASAPSDDALLSLAAALCFGQDIKERE